MSGRLGLFEAFGIELEYMIVDRETLSVKPVADRLMDAVSPGDVEAEVEFGPIAWSNELVLHVIELKTNGPSPRLTGLAQHFQQNVRRVDKELEAFGARVIVSTLPGPTGFLLSQATAAIPSAIATRYDLRMGLPLEGPVQPHDR